MSKHVSFWLGVFAAGLLIMPVALGAWALAHGFAEDIAAALFVAIGVLVFLLVAALFLRGPILRRLIGRSEASIEDLSTSLIASVSAAASGDRARAEAEAGTLARIAMGWYAWSNFYRWVIGAALGLLLAFASFTGTVLLFEQLEKLDRQTGVMDQQRQLMVAQTAFMESQTQRLEEQTQQAKMQNEIMTLSLVSELREQLLATVEEVKVFDFVKDELADHFLKIRVQDQHINEIANGEECSLMANRDATLYRPPSDPTQLAIFELANEGALSGRFVSALRFLLKDRNSAVAFGAANVLAMLGKYESENNTVFDGIILTENEIKMSGEVSLVRSALLFANCEDCQIEISASALVMSDVTVGAADHSFLIQSLDQYDPDLEIYNSIAWIQGLEGPSRFNIKLNEQYSIDLSWARMVKIESLNVNTFSFPPYVMNELPYTLTYQLKLSQPSCSDLEDFALSNPFWDY